MMDQQVKDDDVFNHIYGRSINEDEKLGWSKMATPTSSTSKYDQYLNKKMSIKTSFTIILIAALIIWSFIYTGFSIGDLMIGIPQIGAFFGQMVPPDWSYLDQITKPMLDTVWQL